MISRTFTPTIALTNAKVQANPQDDSATGKSEYAIKS